MQHLQRALHGLVTGDGPRPAVNPRFTPSMRWVLEHAWRIRGAAGSNVLTMAHLQGAVDAFYRSGPST